MKKIIICVLTFCLLTSCTGGFEPKKETLTILDQYEHFAYDRDGWRTYVNPITGYTFTYPIEHFLLDNMLDIINLNDVEEDAVKEHFMAERNAISSANEGHYSIFYSTNEILIVTYKTIGAFKGKYKINISNIGVTHSLIFYKNDRRIILTAGKSYSGNETYDVYNYFDALKKDTLGDDDNHYFRIFYNILETLEPYGGKDF